MSEFDLPLASHMVAPLHVLSPDERLPRAASLLHELGVSALPVTDSRRRLIGVLERTDLLRVGRLRARPEPGEPRFWWPDLSVAECMQTTVPIAPPERTLRQCAQRMLERSLHRVYVLGDAELLGVVSTRELLRAVQRSELTTPVAALAAEPAELVDAEAPLAAACPRLAASAERALLVLAAGKPSGVFGRAELRACLEVDPAQPVAPYSDESLLVLDAEEAVSRAAELALSAKVRYVITRDVITRDRAGVFRIISGLSFATCICGGAQAPRARAEGLPTVTTMPVALPHTSGREAADEPPATPPLPGPLGRASTAVESPAPSSPAVPSGASGAVSSGAVSSGAVSPEAVSPEAVSSGAVSPEAVSPGAPASSGAASGGAMGPASERRAEPALASSRAPSRASEPTS